MRLTTPLSDLLGLEDTRARRRAFVDDGLVVDVAGTTAWRDAGGGTSTSPGWGGTCATTVAGSTARDARSSSSTCRGPRSVLVHSPFEDQVGYLAQRSDKTTVRKLMRVAWTTVGDIIQRVVRRHQRTSLLDGLTHIGVDELSYRRHHKYVTVVVDHTTQRLVWAKEGKNAATLKAFFAELGPERVAKLEAVTIDMSAAYIHAVTEASPQAQIIFDRFHVQRLAHDALDQVRRAEVREAPTPAARTGGLKGMRWRLLRRAWN